MSSQCNPYVTLFHAPCPSGQVLVAGGAADFIGDLFYTIGGTNVWYQAAGSTTPVLLTSVASVQGMRADALGNLFIADRQDIYEVPFLNGAPSPSNAFFVVPQYSANSMGIAPNGDICTTYGSAIVVSTVGNANFGAANVGTPTPELAINLLFSGSVTLSSLTFTSGASATSEIAYSPTTASPTGTVTFSVPNGATLGTASLVGITATLVTTTLPTGTYSIIATYSGDTGFAGSVSNTVQVAILPPQHVVSDTPTTVTMTADQTTSATFLISPISGYIGAVDMQCSSLPANTTCSFPDWPFNGCTTRTMLVVQNVGQSTTYLRARYSTVTVTVLEVDVLSLASPLYLAVMM